MTTDPRIIPLLESYEVLYGPESHGLVASLYEIPDPIGEYDRIAELEFAHDAALKARKA